MNNELETVVAVLDTTPPETEQGIAEQVVELEFQAEKLVVTSDSQYAEAGAFGRQIKEKMAEVTQFFAPLKKSAHEAHAQICAREKSMLQPLKAAETMLKKAMSEYTMKIEKARREAEEAVRRLAREEAERKLAEGIAAEESGDSKTAEMAMLDAQFAEEAARALVIDTQETKVSGVSTTVDWEIESVDEKSVPIDFSGTTIRPVDTATVLRLIRASKGTIEIPGIKYKETRKMSFRR